VSGLLRDGNAGVIIDPGMVPGQDSILMIIITMKLSVERENPDLNLA